MKSRLFLWLVLYFLVQPVFAQEIPYKQLPSHLFAASENFNSLVQDRSGNIWIGTSNALYIYDSESIERISGIGSVSELALRGNDVLVSTSTGILSFDSLFKSTKIFDEATIDIAVSDKGNLAILNVLGEVLRLRDDQWQIEELTSEVTKIEFITESLFLATETGLLKVTDRVEETEVGKNVLDIFKNDKGTWVLTETSVYAWQEDSFVPVVSDIDFQPTHFLVDHEGTIWFNTENKGIVRKDNLSTKSNFFPTSLVDPNVKALFQDNENNLWVGSNFGLSVFYLNTPFVRYGVMDGLSSRINQNISIDSEGRLYASHLNNVISVFDDDKWSVLRDRRAREKKLVGVFVDEEDFVWISYQDGSISRLNGTKSTNRVISANQPISILGQVGPQEILALYDATLVKIDRTRLNVSSILHEEPVLIRSTSKIVEGMLYFVNADYEIKSVDMNSGEISVLEHSDFRITSIHKNQMGLWAGTTDHGVVNIKDPTLSLKQENGLNSNNVSALFTDSQSNLWVATDQGLNKLTFDNREIQTISNYDSEDGFPVTRISSGSIVEDDLQRVWIATVNGLYRYDPLQDNPNLYAPTVNIKTLTLNTRDLLGDIISRETYRSLPDRLVVKKRDDLFIEATSINFLKRGKTRLEYNFEGVDVDWQAFEKNSRVNLDAAPNGEATLLIRTVNSEQISGSRYARVPLMVQSNWVGLQKYIIGAASSFLLLIGFVFFISRNRKQSGGGNEEELRKQLAKMDQKQHESILKAEKLKNLNDLIYNQREELESKNAKIESQKYELALSTEQIKKQRNELQETSRKLTASINYSKRIQTALMDTMEQIEENLLDSFVLFMPRDVVSGDFFWFKKLDPRPVYQEQYIEEEKQIKSVLTGFANEKMVIAAVDCTGHGVPGAIVSVVGINLLNNIVQYKGVDEPGKVLSTLHIDLRTSLRHDDTEVNDGMDMALCTIDLEEDTLQFAGAKNSLVYIQDGELIELKGDRFAIGGQQKEGVRKFTTHTLPLNSKEEDGAKTYYMYSDGYQDQFGGEKGKKFMSKHLKTLIKEIHELPMKEQKVILEKKIVEWKGDRTQTDDILVMGFRI